MTDYPSLSHTQGECKYHDGQTLRQYLEPQEAEDKRLDQVEMFK